MNKVVIVTGGTSGIGLNTARALTKQGCRVYEFSRREEGTDAAIHIRADVTDELQVLDGLGPDGARKGAGGQDRG